VSPEEEQPQVQGVPMSEEIKNSLFWLQNSGHGVGFLREFFIDLDDLAYHDSWCAICENGGAVFPRDLDRNSAMIITDNQGELIL
jgi:hypothetical protein